MENAAKLWKARFGCRAENASNSRNGKDFQVNRRQPMEVDESFELQWKTRIDGPWKKGAIGSIESKGFVFHVERFYPSHRGLFHVERGESRHTNFSSGVCREQIFDGRSRAEGS